MPCSSYGAGRPNKGKRELRTIKAKRRAAAKKAARARWAGSSSSRKRRR